MSSEVSSLTETARQYKNSNYTFSLPTPIFLLPQYQIVVDLLQMIITTLYHLTLSFIQLSVIEQLWFCMEYVQLIYTLQQLSLSEVVQNCMCVRDTKYGVDEW